MNAQKIILPNAHCDRYLKYSLDLHHKRLKEISEKANKIPSPLYRLKKRNKIILGNKKIERELDMHNMKILDKLIKIAKNKEKPETRSLTPKPKTLNSIIRKKEAYRVAEENKRIAQRIVSKSPVLSLKVFEKQFEVYNKHKKMLMKYSSLHIKHSSYCKKNGQNTKMSKKIVDIKGSLEGLMCSEN
ncbi:hypothetical protein SteCoe_37512 [Stentor coeruleus]|uniref:Uncharacterized protein n=1 Tax=Stentor coeruleus TaxID=5963 RepID=A0A1R2AMW3_9CILI|nr:hypothetical protein SteCoe_37512 [Stentor coeruleus]